MAKKSKTDAGAAPAKVTKSKRSLPAGGPGRTGISAKAGSTSSKSKKSSSSKKPAVEKVDQPLVQAMGAVFDPTDEQISMRAYFISERRRRFDLPGDANSDWLEAKRQLLSETRH